MQEKLTFIEPLFEKAEQYGKTSLELIKLKAIDKSSQIAGTFISRTLAVLVFSMFLIVATIGVALWLGDLLGKSYYGFFCVAAFYLIIGSVIFFMMHNKIKNKVSNSIITQSLN